jgi:hypothetical protein
VGEPERVEYEVVLVFPSFGPERDDAEQMVQAALDHLNIPCYEPGFRFAPHVTARLEVVTTIEMARDRLGDDGDLAMMLLHDIAEDEKLALTEECAEAGVLVCHTFPTDDRPGKRKKKGGWTFTLNPSKEGRPRAHRIPDVALRPPHADDPEVMSDRVGQIIAVLALGVMENHWHRRPPRSYLEG